MLPPRFPVLVSFASFWLVLAPPEPFEASAEAQPTEAAEPDLSEAKRLFDEGTARYDAADFPGAIEVFTLALSELRKQGVSDFRIRGLLLFNIGRTHTRAFGIDDDIGHLRQAKSIFTSFIDEAEEHPDEVDAADIEEAKAQLIEIDRLLAADSIEPAPQAKSKRDKQKRDKPERDRPEPSGDPQKLRTMGIGLTAGGGALLGVGVGMVIWGAGFGAAAEREVAGLDDLGLAPGSPAFADGAAFIDSERRKGSAWMGVGGLALGLGVGGIAVGIRQLVTAKRIEQHGARERSFVPTGGFGRQGAWFGFAGRF
jgi:hypothetical protein